jgi:hypothetical protein
MDKSWSEALEFMRRALAILDECAAPPEVGAHLDLAIARLEGRFGDLGLDGSESVDGSHPRQISEPNASFTASA